MIRIYFHGQISINLIKFILNHQESNMEVQLVASHILIRSEGLHGCFDFFRSVLMRIPTIFAVFAFTFGTKSIHLWKIASSDSLMFAIAISYFTLQQNRKNLIIIDHSRGRMHDNYSHCVSKVHQRPDHLHCLPIVVQFSHDIRPV